MEENFVKFLNIAKMILVWYNWYMRCFITSSVYGYFLSSFLNFYILVLIFPISAPPFPKQTWSLHQYVSSGWQTVEENPPQFYTVIQQLKDQTGKSSPIGLLDVDDLSIDLTIIIITIIMRDIGKDTQSSICCVKDNWENWLNLRHTLDRIYQTSILEVPYFQTHLHDNVNEVVSIVTLPWRVTDTKRTISNAHYPWWSTVEPLTCPQRWVQMGMWNNRILLK